MNKIEILQRKMKGDKIMCIIVFGDEMLVRDRVVKEITTLFPHALVKQNTTENMLYKICEFVETKGNPDYIFFDFSYGRRLSEIERTEIKRLAPGARIVCCSAGNEYTLEVIRYVDSILMKPITQNSILQMVEKNPLGYSAKSSKKQPVISVHTFGNFDVFVEGKPLVFARNKAKELFAYLIDRKGAGATTSEIASVLWEDREYSKGILSQTTRTISVLRKTLEQKGVGDVLVKSWNSLAIDPEKVNCDAYAYEKGEEWAINAYHGEYMKNYSWAEATNGKMQENAGLDEKYIW